MGTPAKLNFRMYQGGTFNETLRWESSTIGYKEITGISKSAPLVVTVPGHSIPTGWRVKFTNIVGMTELNSADTYNTVTTTGTGTITINAINSLGYKAYTSGGTVEYNTPVDLTGFTARAQLRSKVDSDVIVHAMTTENGGIIIDNVLKTISLYISAENTALFDFSTAVYSLELISSGLQVTPLETGTITLIKEVTR